MRSTVTGEDVGKTVESADGRDVGTVAAVDSGVLHVDPKPGFEGSIRATFGRESDADADDAVAISDDVVREVTADAVRLEVALSGADASSGVEEGDDPPVGDRRGTDADEMARIEEEASRELEVDPTELADRDADADDEDDR